MDAECRVYGCILLKEYDKGVFLHENHKKVDLNKVCAFMVKAHIDCAPVLTLLYCCIPEGVWGLVSPRVVIIFS